MKTKNILLGIIAFIAVIAIVFTGYQYQQQKLAANAQHEVKVDNSKTKKDTQKKKAEPKKKKALGPENISGLQTDEEKALAKIPKHPVTVLAHRGLPSEAPEHTFEGYDKAIKQGANYIEQDLWKTADNQLVVFHDETLQRIFNDISAPKNSNLANLQQFKYKNGEPIHTLEEVFNRYKNNTNYIIETRNANTLDVNDPNNTKKFTEENILIDLIKKHHLEGNIILQSYHIDSLNYLAQKLPNIPKMLLISDPKAVDKNIEQIKNIQIISIFNQYLNENIIKKYHAANKKVYTFMQNEQPDDAKNTLIHNDVDGIFTDYTGKTVGLLKKQGRYEKNK